MVGLALTPAPPTTNANGTAPTSPLPTTAQLLQMLSQENFAGVSCQIALRVSDNVLVTSTRAEPVILSVQPDGSLQIAG
jgi:hypothetical protein